MKARGPLVTGFVGDLMFSHRIREAQEATGDDRYPLKPVLSLLASCERLVGNFETPVSHDRIAIPGARPDYWARPGSADALKTAGFDLVTLANNHIYDFGDEGVEATLVEMRGAGVATCGLDGPVESGHAGFVAGDAGRRIGVLAYCGMRNVAVPGRRYSTRADDPVRIEADVRTLSSCVDHVVVVLHAGGSALPTPETEVAARRAVAAGADLVVVHHSHVLSGIERVGRALIAWGLGNFVAATNNVADERREGGLLRCTFTDEGVAAWDFTPTWVSDDWQVIPAPAPIAARIRTRMNELGRLIAAGGAREAYEASITSTVVARRLAEAAREMLRGGPALWLSTLRAMRPRHLRFVWLGVRALAGRVLSRRP